jgi:plasmid maintenance system antidote protein VapI
MAPVATGDFTAKEVAHVRAALRFLRLRCGSWATLAPALRFNETTLSNIAGGHKPVTAALAVRIAKFAKVGVDDVLTGKFPQPGVCAHCGHVSTGETQTITSA